MARRILITLLAFCMFIPAVFASPYVQDTPRHWLVDGIPDVPAGGPGISAASAILMDAATGRVLFARNPDERRLIASTTKLMTALAAASILDVDGEYTVTDADVRVEGSSMYLRAGETLTVMELLYGLILRSGNDAAMALGGAAGGVDVLVAEMNRLAAEYGMENTSFANPHGLDHENHYSTARDMAILAIQAAGNELVAQLCRTREIHIGERFLSNHNRLLRNLPGCEGLKTGYTRRAGRCLVSTVVQDGHRLVAVTLNAPDDWRDHHALYTFGYTYYPARKLAHGGGPFGGLYVISGTSETVGLTVDRTIALPLSQAEMGRLEVYQSTPPFVYAPVAAGRTAGTVRYVLDGVTVAEATLFYSHNVALDAPPRPRPSLWRRFWGWVRGR
jgi:D-alanyl-D-alanine carboxypeptidase (penicillin-binding protein 5/6)